MHPHRRGAALTIGTGGVACFVAYGVRERGAPRASGGALVGQKTFGHCRRRSDGRIRECSIGQPLLAGSDVVCKAVCAFEKV